MNFCSSHNFSLKFLKISKVYRFWAKLWIVSRINLIHIFYLNKAYNCVYRQVRNLNYLFYESSSVSLTPSNVEGLIPSGTSFLLNLKIMVNDGCTLVTFSESPQIERIPFLSLLARSSLVGQLHRTIRFSEGFQSKNQGVNFYLLDLNNLERFEREDWRDVWCFPPGRLCLCMLTCYSIHLSRW